MFTVCTSLSLALSLSLCLFVSFSQSLSAWMTCKLFLWTLRLLPANNFSVQQGNLFYVWKWRYMYGEVGCHSLVGIHRLSRFTDICFNSFTHITHILSCACLSVCLCVCVSHLPICTVFSVAASDGRSSSVTTLAVVIVAPVIVLIFLSAVAILVFRRIHKNQMERLTARDAEYGTIDGLIASNVGENTLAVSRPCNKNTVAVSRLCNKNTVAVSRPCNKNTLPLLV